jgi:hypothetical protein
MRIRRKITAVRSDFRKEIGRLLNLDRDNQRRLASGVGAINKQQMYTLTESVFFYTYRCYENLVRDIFILCCLGKPNMVGIRAHSYLRPKNFSHAEDLIKSSLRYVEWSNPDELIKRADLYLKDGEPIKTVLISNRVILHDIRKLRNHIAHNSSFSRTAYIDVIRRKIGTVPLRLPSVGEFLLTSDGRAPHRYHLLTYMEDIERVAEGLAGR